MPSSRLIHWISSSYCSPSDRHARACPRETRRRLACAGEPARQLMQTDSGSPTHSADSESSASSPGSSSVLKSFRVPTRRAHGPRNRGSSKSKYRLYMPVASVTSSSIMP
eukprot:scaffold1628_cov407-Prasinococcus_capsulatus_cf.AAC.18